MKQKLEELNKKFKGAKSEEILAFVLNEHKCKAAFSTSLGAEDQVITDMMVKVDACAKIFTLDTGRQFYETYDTLDKTNAKYGINIEIMFPDAFEVESMVKEKGINLFYESIENRKNCCNIRKLQPLKRALKSYEVWITGIRREQSVTREDMQLFEWDNDLQMVKVNPLLDWSEKDTWKYIRENKVPYNILHDKGYPSIGCAPCTRAVEKGENPRNGRWWWENADTKECGLHLHVKTS
ncbi:MAG: phosphoadenylyl-sulfate reductase [Bacteroidetes bacterium]|jgi:phosphoadenosine phosphosulfate reductase|nr:phosphoadenylyl-sulfate reductase [Bacteroidota bacterium]MBT3802207.1 phosphoadenylyl-sulfate reductase [Bacteroidota bacterium]MBT4337406.1 phosphoadenylyl-sulfate reductase [Bacteroidota bacterium]MBT4728531.1 phosphoadenylyl-sulfate reductase [Bacteroidota bacterium]MBT4967958.1 phosphoadenylyl-sulfate reductase [Bacteroidota bacterium]